MPLISNLLNGLGLTDTAVFFCKRLCGRTYLEAHFCWVNILTLSLPSAAQVKARAICCAKLSKCPAVLLYQGRHPVIQFPSVCIWKDEQIDSYRPTWQSARLYLSSSAICPSSDLVFLHDYTFPVKESRRIMGFQFPSEKPEISVFSLLLWVIILLPFRCKRKRSFCVIQRCTGHY